MVIANNVIHKCINDNDNSAYSNIDNIEWNNIVLSVLRCTDSDCPFGIFKLFLNKGDNFFHNFPDFLVDIFWTGEVIFVFSVPGPRDQVSYIMTLHLSSPSAYINIM